MERKGIFTGTFDPFTIGHASIVERALPLFDALIIGVAESKLKHTSRPAADRVAAIRQLYAKEPKIQVTAYSDLTIDLAHRMGAQFLVRGIRSVKDFEYERQQADVNRRIGGIETVLLFAEPGLDSISSSLVRELEFFGKDVSQLLPEP
jgi:pantetheine-phosphate adenylyltransferase